MVLDSIPAPDKDTSSSSDSDDESEIGADEPAISTTHDSAQEEDADLEENVLPKTAGELTLSDLPPIEDLTISLPVDKLVKIGKIVSIVDVLVVIESIRSMPPLDLDTVLFKSDGTAIGQVFDTFGSVTEPHYSVRFTCTDQIKEKGVELNQDIYFSPQAERVITKFAFVDQLKKIKGTDASWKNDNERPPTIDTGEYSDDEEERRARRRRKSISSNIN